MPETIDIYSRHAHFLEQYYNGESDKLIPYLNRIAKRLRLQLTETQTVRSKAKIERLLVFTQDLVKAELSGFTFELSKQIELFTESEAEFTVDTVDGQDSLLNTKLPAPAQLNAAVNARPFNNRLLKEYLNEFTTEQSRMVRNAVSMGFFEGKTTQEIVQSIVGTRSQNFKNGILNVTRTSGERMVRTALAHTSAVAKAKVFEDNEDIIPYYEWVSTLDGITSSICRAGDSNVYRVGKGPIAPHHFNCRSTEAPLFSEDVKVVKKTKKNPSGFVKIPGGGKRASQDGPVSADLNYNDWLKRQSKSFQVDVLGKDKTELFRKGDLTMKQFVNDRGKSLTLDQLKAKYPVSWGKADL